MYQSILPLLKLNSNWIIQGAMNQEAQPENRSQSDENILANSIRIVRERFVKNDSKMSNNQISQVQIQSHSSSLKNSKTVAPAAQAIRVLHEKISELEAFNSGLTKQNTQMKREVNLKSRQCRGFEEEVMQLRAQVSDWEGKYSKLNSELSQKIAEKEEELIKVQEVQEEMKKENQGFLMQKQEAKKVQRLLEQKVEELNKRINSNQKIIVDLIRDLEQEKEKNAKLHTPVISKSNEANKNLKSKSGEFPVIVDQIEEEEQLVSSYKRNKIRRSSNERETRIAISRASKKQTVKNNEKDSLAIMKNLHDKNQQLYTMLKAAEKKFRDEEKAKNEIKNKFYWLKNSVDALIEEINRLPENLLYKFKRLIVRVNKIEGDHLECLRSHHRHSKSSRMSSKGSSSKSRSREKPLKMEDLNASEQFSIKSRSHSNSKAGISNYILSSNSAKKRVNNRTQENANISRLLNRRIKQKNKEILQIHKMLKNEQNTAKVDQLHEELTLIMEETAQLHEELNQWKIKNQ